ncbi:MAG: DUF5522 domain-containing protein [Chitinophagales bacterium]
MENKLVKDIDYYLDEIGRMVFTEAYHLKRGHCCKNDCKHCPWKDVCNDEKPTKQSKNHSE